MSDPAETAIRELMESASAKWTRQTGFTWRPLFIHTLLYVVEWLAALQPEPTRELLKALDEMYRPGHDRESFERARKIVGVRQIELIDALDEKEPTKQ